MPEQVPIIFIHRGNSPYLAYTLAQCRYWNPTADIILLGDRASAHLAGPIIHADYTRFCRRAHEFADIYQHHSTNGLDYELFCLQRWYILDEYLRAAGCRRAIYLDSDILVYSDLTEIACRGQMSVVGTSAHTNFIADVECLAAFLEFVWEAYRAPNRSDRLSDLLQDHRRLCGEAGGISDMTFFRHYRNRFPDLITDLSGVAPNQTCFDIALDEPQGFRMQDGYKQIAWSHNQPVCRHASTGVPVRFHTLHLQGRSKALLHQLLRPGSRSYWRYATRHRGMLIAQYLRRRLLA